MLKQSDPELKLLCPVPNKLFNSCTAFSFDEVILANFYVTLVVGYKAYKMSELLYDVII